MNIDQQVADARALIKLHVDELDHTDDALISKLRHALKCCDDGNPLKDFVDEDDLVDVVRLLITIIDVEQEIANETT